MLFYCDVCPYPSELGQTNPELPSADYLATIAWVGEKPAEELCQKSRAIGKETIIGALTLLIKNEDGIATFGKGPSLNDVRTLLHCLKSHFVTHVTMPLVK
jgi:hypothetical protein